jgi:hypothetical protein
MLGVGNTDVCLRPDVSPALANMVWCLTYVGFDKIVFDIDTLFDDYLDRSSPRLWN